MYVLELGTVYRETYVARVQRSLGVLPLGGCALQDALSLKGDGTTLHIYNTL